MRNGGGGGLTRTGTDYELTISNVRLWSADESNLYTAHITAGEGDTAGITFGIRQITWSNKGLFINVKTLLRGGCVYHDNGILGAATYAESEERRVRILKENGFNAIRFSHNPASKALLDACDKLGMYVMDEAFDMWYNRKNPFDYGLDLPHWCGGKKDKLLLKGSLRLPYNASLFAREGPGFLLSYDHLFDTSPGSGFAFCPLSPNLKTKMYLIGRKYQIYTPISERLLSLLKDDMTSHFMTSLG